MAARRRQYEKHHARAADGVPWTLTRVALADLDEREQSAKRALLDDQ